MNKQQLAAAIWEAANKMRSKIEANEYKDYILGFIFYKFLSDNEERFLRKGYYSDDDIKELLSDADIEKMREDGRSEEEINEAIESNRDNIETCLDGIGYYIPYRYLFSTWLGMGRDFSVADVRDALSSFSRYINKSHTRVFGKIFTTLETGLGKLGDSSGTQTKAVSDLIQLIQRIPMDEKQDYDVLGFIYEYLISNFAANAGKKAGEFYTPHEVSMLMSEIVAYYLQDKKEISIYDPTSGSGSLLINIGKAIAKHNENRDSIKYYAQELKENTYNLTRMNLVMRGILPDNIVTRNGDTLEDDWPYFDEDDPLHTYHPLCVDAVVSNPPYSQNWDPTNKQSDERFQNYGVAPKSKADYAFLLHDLFHLKDDGIMTIVLPHGVLFRGGEEGEIRKNLIEKNRIEAIIGLPANIFFGTGIPTIIMVLRKERPSTDVLIIDASKGFEKVGKNNKLRSSDIKRITDTVISRQTIEGYSRLVSRDEIRRNDYNLNIPRYVDSSEKAESWDIYASMFGGIPDGEINDLSRFWDAFPSLRSELFKSAAAGPYSILSAEDIKKAVSENSDVIAFRSAFCSVCDDFSAFLEAELLDDMENISIAKEETCLSERLFSDLDQIPLVDRYEAYQILDDEWNRISIDLEIIQTEGFKAIKEVDPRIVVKKKDGKDVELQDGWIGRIIPFELIQKEMLSNDLLSISGNENRLQEIQSSLEEEMEGFSEDEKDRFLNEDGDAIVSAAVSSALKQLKKDCSPDEVELKSRLMRIDLLEKEGKKLKSDLKKATIDLQLHTKKAIEELSDDMAKQLIRKKWIDSLIANLKTIPEAMISSLSSSVEKLSKKYAETYSDISEQIENVSKELISYIDDLTGNEFDMKGLEELKELLK